MRDIRSFTFVALVTVCLPAFAYIDPGSGSALVSLVIGFFVALGLLVKTYWYKLESLFTKQSQPAVNLACTPEHTDED